jgi:ketosteroid isomerase-like protein
MSDERLAIAQTFFQRFFDGDVDEAAKLLGPRVEFHVPGRSGPAGTFIGPEDVTKHLRTFLEATETPINVLQREDWLAGSMYVAGVVRCELQRPGRVHEFRLIFLVQVGADDKIARVEAFFSDPEALERFFAG